MTEWLRIARSPTVVCRGVRTAVIVGSLLIAINYGDAILQADLGSASFLKMGLTFLVPYLVSTASSVSAIRNPPGRARSANGSSEVPEPADPGIPRS